MNSTEPAGPNGSELSERLGLVQERDLVERLRLQWPDTPHHRDALHREAADEIERLRGIVPEVLERLNDDLCAENERLRQALLKCKTCALPTEVRELVNKALRA